MPSTNGETGPRFTRGRLSRGLGLRKTTGCLTCRRRHVKCDESKPKCGGCTKLQQVCAYGNGQPASRNKSKQLSEPTSPPEIDVASTSPVNPDQSEHAITTQNEEPAASVLSESQIQQEADLLQASSNVALSDISAAASVHSHLITSMATHQEMPDHTVDFEGPPVVTPQGFPPASATSSENLEGATSRWIDLLLHDADMQDGARTDLFFEADGMNIFGNSCVQSPAEQPLAVPESVTGHEDLSKPVQSSSPYLFERSPYTIQYQIFEKQEWHSDMPIQLLPYEQSIFQAFVSHISQWLDLFDPHRPFGTLVPHLAMHNVGLVNAILAFSTRYLSLKPSSHDYIIPDTNNTLYYYNKALHYIQKAMRYDTYKTSLELLATALIISAYEMLDGSSQDWQRHLHGVFCIQRSQVIHGDSQGLRQAVWWAWLCQDAWAAFYEKRKPFTFWQPKRSLNELNPHELAARSVYFFAQVVAYCSMEETEGAKDSILVRIAKADSLTQRLEEWKSHLTTEFQPLPFTRPSGNSFDPIWINPPAFAVAIQLYYCSHILLLLHRPVVGGMETHMEMRKRIIQYAKIVCGIAMTLSDSASAVMCSQCIFIAGLSLEDANQRRCVRELLENLRQRTGWPVKPLSDELNIRWGSSDR